MYNDAMQRTTIMAPEELLRQLRLAAAERGVYMAELIREALEEKARARRPKPRSLGLGASGRSDLSIRAGEEGFVPEPWR
jgi:hypothetical protein